MIRTLDPNSISTELCRLLTNFIFYSPSKIYVDFNKFLKKCLYLNSF